MIDIYFVFGFIWFFQNIDNILKNANGSFWSVLFATVINVIAWPICLSVAFYNKMKGKKVLFEEKK